MDKRATYPAERDLIYNTEAVLTVAAHKTTYKLDSASWGVNKKKNDLM